MWCPYGQETSTSGRGGASHGPQTFQESEENDEYDGAEDDDVLSTVSSSVATSCTSGYPAMMYPALHGYHPLLYPTVGVQRSPSWSATGCCQSYACCGYSSLVNVDAGMQPAGWENGAGEGEAGKFNNGLSEVDEEAIARRKKYSDTSLRPDSSLPPVIRRRNHNRRKLLAQSMVETPPWQSARNRSQSVSDEQWSRLLASKGHPPPPPPPPHLQDNSSTSRGRFGAPAAPAGGINNMGSSRGGGGLTRGVTSSASVCDLNMIAQQPLHQHQQQQQQMMPHMGGMQQSGSFQQLNMVPYTGGMLWPAPCDMCHQHPMYPPPMPGHPMKRAASNISVNMSSASSDVTGYPWQPHMHHHMPPPQVMYPGYYPPPPHMVNSMQGSSISIPESMAAFSKVSSSPAPSVRSSSRRSHKSSKSRSFSTADLSRRGRSQHRSDSTDSTTSSPSLEDDFHSTNKTRFTGIPLAWQCDHCTFINQAGSRVCGMCSKSQAASSGGQQQRNGRRSGGERRRSDQHQQPQLRRYQSNRRNEQEEDDRDGSDYDNDGKQNNGVHNGSRDNRKDKNGKSSSSSRSKKKWRRRGGSSGSASDAVEELERQFSDIKVSKTRGPEYEGLSSRLREREKDRDRERGSRRREGKAQRRD